MDQRQRSHVLLTKFLFSEQYGIWYCMLCVHGAVMTYLVCAWLFLFSTFLPIKCCSSCSSCCYCCCCCRMMYMSVCLSVCLSVEHLCTVLWSVNVCNVSSLTGLRLAEGHVTLCVELFFYFVMFVLLRSFHWFCSLLFIVILLTCISQPSNQLYVHL